MSIKRTVVYYEKPGKEHTEETLKIVLDASKQRGIGTVLVASTTGATALKAMETFKDSGLNLIVVTHQNGWLGGSMAHDRAGPGVQLMPNETRQKLEKAGIKVLTCTDALTGGVEVGIAQQSPMKSGVLEATLPPIVPPVNRIISSALKLWNNPTKVCAEITMMAADSGLVGVDKPIIAVAGNHAGCDTAIIVTPSTTNRILNMKLHEFLVKPM